MSIFLIVVGVIFISLTPLLYNISLLLAGILFIALASIIENQQTLIRKNDLIIHYLKLNQSKSEENNTEID